MAGLSACIEQELSRLRRSRGPDPGEADASFEIAFAPLPN
jgi:hypothetical protein